MRKQVSSETDKFFTEEVLGGVIVTVLRESDSGPHQSPFSPCTETTVKQTMQHVLNGNLNKHAISEIFKALFQFEQRADTRRDSSWFAGLQFSPWLIAGVVQLVEGRPNTLTERGAVSLATVVEYICAEVLELAGNAAKNSLEPLHICSAIDPRHVFLGIRGDEELDILFPSSMMNSGIVPHIHKSVHLPEGTGPAILTPAQKKLMSSRTARMKKDDVALDLEGRYCARPEGESSLDDSTWDLSPAHILDAISPASREARKLEEFDTLSHADQTLVKEMRKNPFQAYQRRIGEIREAHESTHRVFDDDVFLRLIVVMCGEARPGSRTDYTKEAAVAIQIMTENYLALLLEDAYSNTLHAGRRTLLPKDLQLARRIRGERD